MIDRRSRKYWFGLDLDRPRDLDRAFDLDRPRDFDLDLDDRRDLLLRPLLDDLERDDRCEVSVLLSILCCLTSLSSSRNLCNDELLSDRRYLLSKFGFSSYDLDRDRDRFCGVILDLRSLIFGDPERIEDDIGIASIDVDFGSVGVP